MSISRFTCVGTLAALLVAGFPARQSEATLVAPGERLRFSFEFPSAPVLPPGAPAPAAVDTLMFLVHMENPTGFGLPYFDNGVARLYDGGTLVAEDHFFLIRGFSVAAFIAPTSGFSFPQPSALVADFSPIAGGTIDGVLEISFTGFNGPIDFDLSVFGVGQGVASGVIPATPAPTITGRDLIPLIEVPEPSALLLLGPALAAMMARRRRDPTAQSLSSMA